MTATAKIILASAVPHTGVSIYTVHARYWRAIHAELMTHRVFSRNAGSSRAIPVKKVLAQVWNEPAGPDYWGSNQPGMQAGAELTGWRLATAKFLWRLAGKVACGFAWSLVKLGLHKQVANRLLEPWQYINVLITSTDWSNFFNLRDHPDAQPEIKNLAVNIKEAMKNARCQVLQPGQWHVPYVTTAEWATFSMPELLKLSTARCARISYAPFDGNADPQKEFERHDKLVGSEPIHASPTEHQARAASTGHYYRNFCGFEQYRIFVETGRAVWS